MSLIKALRWYLLRRGIGYRYVGNDGAGMIISTRSLSQAEVALLREKWAAGWRGLH